MKITKEEVKNCRFFKKFSRTVAPEDINYEDYLAFEEIKHAHKAKPELAIFTAIPTSIFLIGAIWAGAIANSLVYIFSVVALMFGTIDLAAFVNFHADHSLNFNKQLFRQLKACGAWETLVANMEKYQQSARFNIEKAEHEYALANADYNNCVDKAAAEIDVLEKAKNAKQQQLQTLLNGESATTLKLESADDNSIQLVKGDGNGKSISSGTLIKKILRKLSKEKVKKMEITFEEGNETNQQSTENSAEQLSIDDINK